MFKIPNKYKKPDPNNVASTPRKKWTKYSTKRSNKINMYFNGRGFRSYSQPESLPFGATSTGKDTYRGIYKDGMRDTTETVQNSDGTLAPKQGKYQWANGNEEYIGEWEKGVAHGSGKLSWNPSEFYQGNFEKGIIQGQGILKIQGERYEGAFDNGQRNGFGVCDYEPSSPYVPPGSNVVPNIGMLTQYAGIWKEDYWNGQGFVKFDSSPTLAGTSASADPITGLYLFQRSGISNAPGDVFYGSLCSKLHDATGSVLNLPSIATLVSDRIYKLKPNIQDVFTSNNPTSRLVREALVIDFGSFLITSGHLEHSQLSGYGTYSWANDKRKRYEGQWVESYREGDGRLLLCNGDTYVGDYSKSKFHGKGVYTWSTDTYGRTSYIGDWMDGLWNGNGDVMFLNGDVYSGVFNKGKSDQKGKRVYSDDEMTYEGEFSIFQSRTARGFAGLNPNDIGDGKIYAYDWIREGKGECIYQMPNRDFVQLSREVQEKLPGLPWSSSSPGVYDGHWVDDKWNGKGRLSLPNGFTYEGDFINGYREGKCELANFPNGELFFGKVEYPTTLIKHTGSWKADMLHGEGRCTFGHDSVYYDGDWVKNVREGHGVFDGPEYRYDGPWKSNDFEGFGICIFKVASNPFSTESLRSAKFEFPRVDPFPIEFFDISTVDKPDFFSRYIGQWTKSRRQGEGKMQYACEEIYYEGTWLNNQRDGLGKFVCPTYEYVGEWETCRKGVCKHALGHGCRNGFGTLKTLKLSNSDGTFEHRTCYKFNWSRDLISGDGVMVHYKINRATKETIILFVYIGSVEKDEKVGNTEDWKPHGRGILFTPTKKTNNFYAQIAKEADRIGLQREFQNVHLVQYEGDRVIGKPFLDSCDAKIGDFKKGELEGTATEYLADGSTFRGKYKSNKRSYGIHTTPSSDTSIGPYKDDKLHGPAVSLSKSSDGDKLVQYTGDYEEGLPSGFGILVTLKCDCAVNDPLHSKIDPTSLETDNHSILEVFAGYFKKGVKNGSGILYRSCDKSRHIGTWNIGIESLDGVWVHPSSKSSHPTPDISALAVLANDNGNVIGIHTVPQETDFNSILKVILQDSNGNDVFGDSELRFNYYVPSAIPTINSMIQRQISELILDARSVSSDQSITYRALVNFDAFVGEYDGVHALKGVSTPETGRGKIYYGNGNLYVGGVKHFLKHGKGRLEVNCNRKLYDTMTSYSQSKWIGVDYFNYVWYEGDYVDDKRHGEGKLMYRTHVDRYSGFKHLDGDVYVGSFANDMRNGEGELTFIDRVLSPAEVKKIEGVWDVVTTNPMLATKESNFTEIAPGSLTGLRIVSPTSTYVKCPGKKIWKDDKLVGPHISHHAHDYSVSVSPYEDTIKNGKDAVHLFPDGSKYVGEVKDGKIHGYGTYYYKDGSVYVGNFEEDVKHDLTGKAEYSFKDGLWDCVYIGEFRDGKRNGKGTLIYRREYIDKVTNLKVFLEERYVGNWANGLKDGNGMYKWKEDIEVVQPATSSSPSTISRVNKMTQTYKGTFVKGAMSGHGEMTTNRLNPKDQKEYLSESYKGDFLADMKCGRGKMIHADGTSYVGDMDNDKKHGSGELLDLEGNVVESGVYSNGKFKGSDGSGKIDTATKMRQFLLSVSLLLGDSKKTRPSNQRRLSLIDLKTRIPRTRAPSPEKSESV